MAEDKTTVRFLRLAQYERGFHAGADPSRARRGHTLENYHADWKKGFDAGKAAAQAARDGYKLELSAKATP